MFQIQVCVRKKICVRHVWPKFQFHLFFREMTRDKRFLNLKSQEDNYYFFSHDASPLKERGII